ncbi:Regulator of ribonuclease activity A [Candidatus Methanobinarius endosymbioticus]|uniref:Regulator of ribonuclease activity A n=1 Tax=Candidatus Methanobinarius endosymbioticus TaxID=2006182 RepID=A0A366MCX0_9EURY|nr:Regulator of ribonuclease activity A [Candidatus Methanobinarius endosymbioticus]
MEKSKLSSKTLLKQLSQKKYLKNKKTVKVGEIKVCREDFDIDNLDLANTTNSHEKQRNPQHDKKLDIKREFGFKNLKKLLDNTSSCQISDAMSKISKRSGVLEGIKSINGKKAYGIVYTVYTSSDDWGTPLYGIDEAKKGNILFIKTSGGKSAVWGELTSSCSYEKGLAGTVIYGATRDIDFVKNFEYPVFAKETAPNAGNALGLGKTNISIEIETKPKTNIQTGDFIFGDESGVVHVPKELFCEVMIKILEIKKNEAQILSEIKKRTPLSEILGLK